MQCSKCGKELSLTDKVCTVCGNILIEDTPGLDHVKEKEVEEVKEDFVVPRTSYEEKEEEAPKPVFEEAAKEEAVEIIEEESAPEKEEVKEEVKEEEKPQVVLTSPLAPPPQEEEIVKKEEEEVKDFTFLGSHSEEGTTTVETHEEPRETVTYEASSEVSSAKAEAPLAVEYNKTPETVNVDYNKVDMSQSYDAGYQKRTPVGLVIAVVVVACLVFGGLGLLVGSQVFGNKGVTPAENPGNKTGDGDGGETVTPVKTTSVIFAGNKFEIPVEFDYEVKEGKLSIYDENVYYYVQVAPSSYAQYAANIPYIKDNYTKLGYEVMSATERTVLKSRYVILDLVKNTGEKVTLFLRAFTTNQSFVCAVGRTDGKFATNTELNKIENILATKTLIAEKSFPQEDNIKDDALLSVVINSKLPQGNDKEDKDN